MAKAKGFPNISLPEKLTKPNPFVEDKKPIDNNLLSFVSNGLHFTTDVIEQICPHVLPYSSFNGHLLYTSPGMAKQRRPHTTPRRPHRLEPITDTNHKENDDIKAISLPYARWAHAQRVRKQKKIGENKQFQPKESIFFMTEIEPREGDDMIGRQGQREIEEDKTTTTRSSDLNTARMSQEMLEKHAQAQAKKDFENMEKNWDKYMFEHMDENTAKYIILKHVHDESRKGRLIEYLKETYHLSTIPNQYEIELIPSPRKVEDVEKKDSSWKKPESRLLERAEKAKDSETVQDKRHTPLYRLPRGLRRHAKQEMKEESNRTAQNMVIENTQIRREQTFYDIMSDKILSTVYRTDHPYEQAMIMGTNVHQPTDEKGVISLSSKLQFDKVLQQTLPPNPEAISSTLVMDSTAAYDRSKPSKGFRRWKSLPKVKDTTPYMRLPSPEQTVVPKWRRKWQVGSQWIDADIDELYGDLQDIHPHVRFTAVVVCARAAQYRTQKEIDSGLKVHLLPEKLLVALECLLQDTVERVRTASAIALLTLDRYSQDAEDILRVCLQTGSPLDKLAASECLADYGITTSDVIHELLKNYFEADDELTREQIILYLVKLSLRTNLVYSLAGEYLNSADADDRILACKLFPLLRSYPNKDITQKLTHLMWEDINSTVRRISGQALGKCGCGQAVHDELVLRLQSKHWKHRVEALKLIGYLGILTAKLMQPYMNCFKDEHVSVRDYACRTTYKIQLRDENIRNLLVEVANYDSIEKVRYSAIEALGLYGMSNDVARRVLLWAVRYDKSPLVRAAAPAALVLLEKADTDILDTLQDRFLIEKEPIVVKSLKEALELYGCNLSQDMPIVEEIRNEVRKLNQKNTIWEKITNLERELRKAEAIERLIAPEPDRPVTPPISNMQSMSKITDNASISSSGFSKAIRDVADNSVYSLPEIWTPETRHDPSIKKSNKAKNLPITTVTTTQPEEFSVNVSNSEQISDMNNADKSYGLPLTSLMPVYEEHENEDEDENEL
ncbi:unnamed protein product [Didymodactylos carnosus]|uniref:HEAT repeat-containing protein 4 n=1 Tax=Didymodactylos carnosus TaxID=1234261 RepID=A0A813R2A7_9BILA|nr:unnamed protein product [Didymodactylos carnosus]CAF3557631.1 unnamed protein product [Didymodactylos carnosus]